MRRFVFAIVIPLVVVGLFNWRLISTLLRVALFPPKKVPTGQLTKAEEQPNNTLSIPALQLSAPVVSSLTDPTEFSDWNVVKRDLTKGVSLAEKLPKPGESGTTVITGHSSDLVPHRYSAIFAGLNFLEPETEIRVKYQDQIHRYKVVEKKIVQPSDLNFFRTELQKTYGKHRLAMVTCWPLLTTSKRLVILADPL